MKELVDAEKDRMENAKVRIVNDDTCPPIYSIFVYVTGGSSQRGE